MAARSFGRSGNTGARELGAKGGSATSSAKQRSSRDNAKLGGRPKTLATIARETFRCDAWQVSEKNVAFNSAPTVEEWRLLLDYLRISGNLFQIGSALAYRATELRERYRKDQQWLDAREAAYRGSKYFDADNAIERQVQQHIEADLVGFDDIEKALEARLVCESLEGQWLNLPWRHHRDSVAECRWENGTEAIRWLRQAEKEGWRVSELRARIRIAHSQTGAKVVEKRTLTIGSEARRMTRLLTEITEKNPVETWSPLQAQAVIDDFKPLFDALQPVVQQSVRGSTLKT
jgi:hypothetical protein